MNIRNNIFFLKDLASGSPIKNNLNEIEHHLNLGITNETLMSQNLKIEKILSYSVQNTSFYSQFSGKSILDFPIINKNIVREHFYAFKSKQFALQQLKCVVTSGSTGTPFKVLQNQTKVSRNTADTICFGRRAGFDFGQKLYYGKIWNKINRKTLFTKFLQNVEEIDVTSLSDDNVLLIFEKIKKDTSAKGFLAYSSVYDAFLSVAKRNFINSNFSNIHSVIAMSEALSYETQKGMELLFNCPVVSRYSNVENGILAQQDKTKSSFTINFPSYYIEIIDMNSNEPVKDGELGRIIVTDLYNYGMPLIRYDTGDIGSKSLDKLTNLLVLNKVEGRRMDMIYDTFGNLVSSFVITNNMWKYYEVAQYQFIQLSAKEYQFRLNLVKPPFLREAELIKEFGIYFGIDSVIKVEYVDEIPLLNSGKRRKVVNLMYVNDQLSDLHQA